MTGGRADVPWLDLPADHPFGLHNLPYGSFRLQHEQQARVGVAVGGRVLDLTAVSTVLLPERAELFSAGDLDRLLAGGPAVWAQVRDAVSGWFSDTAARSAVEQSLHAAADVVMLLPFTVADYVDFYSSEHHATNVGRMFRPW